jgi:hypothetical protein
MRAIATKLGLLTATLALGACAGVPEFSLDEQMRELAGGVEKLLGVEELPSVHLRTIRSVHMPNSWEFRPSAEDPLGVTRGALRELRTADYATWAEAALVAHTLSSIATDHPAGLARTEALDTLAHVAPWTLAAIVPVERASSEQEVVDALKIIREAHGKDDSDPSRNAQVAWAVQTIAGYRFDEPPEVEDDTSMRSLTAGYTSRLRNARGVLSAFTGSTLVGFETDPAVRDALDRGYVWVSAAVMRLTLLRQALAEESTTTRGTAVRHLGEVQPDGSADVLALLLRDDANSGVRRQTASAIGRFPLDRCVPPLIDALADDMPEVRGAAARALDSITGERFGDDRGAWIRWWAAREAAGRSVTGALGE